jgi:hypothetical protein
MSNCSGPLILPFGRCPKIPTFRSKSLLYLFAGIVKNTQLNVRLPSDLYDRIIKSGRSRKDITIDAFKLYFDVNEHNREQETQQNEKAAYAVMAEQLQTTLNQNLITSQEYEDKKTWWKFW